jgi:hypothetical protein
MAQHAMACECQQQHFIQVKLFEADKKSEFVYRPESGTVVSASASIG